MPFHSHIEKKQSIHCFSLSTVPKQPNLSLPTHPKPHHHDMAGRPHMQRQTPTQSQTQSQNTQAENTTIQTDEKAQQNLSERREHSSPSIHPSTNHPSVPRGICVISTSLFHPSMLPSAHPLDNLAQPSTDCPGPRDSVFSNNLVSRPNIPRSHT